MTDVTSELNLSWDYEFCTLRNYRVEGLCVISSQLPCKQFFVVNVPACSVDEVCSKLKTMGFVRMIKSISVFDGDAFNQPQNANFTDVTPSVDRCGECCSFLVTGDGETQVGVT